MIDIQSYNQYDELLNNEDYFIVYTTVPGCTVCHADYPRVNLLAKEHQFPVYHVDISRIPMLTGQLNLFSSPTVGQRIIKINATSSSSLYAHLG